MEQLYTLKDTFVGFLTSKRRRTVGPVTPQKQRTEEQHEYLPASEPQGAQAQAALLGRIRKRHASTSDTRFGPGSRKRAREDDDLAMEHDVKMNSMELDRLDTTIEEEGEDNRSDIELKEVSPHESASQITPLEGSIDGSDNEEEEEEEIEVFDPESEVSSNEKVTAYLARMAELEKTKEDIEKVKAAGDWHPDEIFLFERLSLRGHEPTVPRRWSEDFRTATWPEIIFAKGNEAFIMTASLDWYTGK